MKKSLITLIACLISTASTLGQRWLPLDDGLNGCVTDLLKLSDSTFVVTGFFTADGDGIPLNGIALWQQGEFHPLSGSNASPSSNIQGIYSPVKINDNVCFMALAEDITNPNITIEGQLISIDGLGSICYDGEQFSVLQFPREVSCLREAGGKVYAGRGPFLSVDVEFNELPEASDFSLDETFLYRLENGQIDSISGLEAGLSLWGEIPELYDEISSFIFDITEYQGGAYFHGPFGYYPALDNGDESLPAAWPILKWQDSEVEFAGGESEAMNASYGHHSLQAIANWQDAVWASSTNSSDSHDLGVMTASGWTPATINGLDFPAQDIAATLDLYPFGDWLFALFQLNSEIPEEVSAHVIARTADGENWEAVAEFSLKSLYKGYSQTAGLENELSNHLTLYPPSRASIDVIDDKLVVYGYFEDINRFEVNHIATLHGFDINELNNNVIENILPAHHNKKTGAIGVGFSDGFTGNVVFSLIGANNTVVEEVSLFVDQTSVNLFFQSPIPSNAIIQGICGNREWTWSLNQNAN